MKTSANIIGYFAAFMIILTAIFKITHLEGAGILFVVSGMLLTIYFPVYIINKLADTNRQVSIPMHYVLALSVGLLQLSLVFKIQHWAGANILLVLGFATLALVYLPMLFSHKLKQSPSPNFRIIYISGFIGALLLSLGLIFKIQHWPAGMELMLFGTGILFIIYFPLYIFNSSKNVEDTYFYLRDLFFALIIGGLLTIFIMTDIIHRKPICNISTDKMNVLYIGIDNPLSIDVRGVPYEEVNVSIDNGTVTGADGKYVAKVTIPGTTVVTVMHGNKKIGEAEFQAKSMSE